MQIRKTSGFTLTENKVKKPAPYNQRGLLKQARKNLIKGETNYAKKKRGSEARRASGSHV